MSQARYAIVPTAAVLDDGLTPTQFKVLCVIGTFLSREAKGFAKQKTIAERMGTTRETVNRAIKVLSEKGYIVVEERYDENGSQLANSYRVVLDPCDARITGGVTPKDHRGCDAQGITGGVTPRGSHLEDTPIKIPHEHTSTDVSFEQAWKLYGSSPLKANQVKKTAKTAWATAMKKADPAIILKAIEAEVTKRKSKAKGEFIASLPAMHRWLNEERWDAFTEPEPDLLTQSAESDLDACFRKFAETGEWFGNRCGYHWPPNHPNANYPDQLYSSHGLQKLAS
ncbi:MAG: helix-turn-helix domain-containing protein [Pseudomonadota bacterium]